MPPEDEQAMGVAERRRLHDRIDKAIEVIAGVRSELTGLVTLVRQSLGEQRAINAKLDEQKRDHELRLRSLETWRAGMERSLPNHVADAADIEKRLDVMSTQIDKINGTLAKWAGIAVAGWAVVEVVVVPALKAGWSALFGG